MQTVVFGYAVDFDVDRVPTVVVDLDRSDESRDHARRVLADRTLRSPARWPASRRPTQALDAGRAAAVLVFPPGLERDLASQRPAEVQVLLDGTDPNRAMVASGAASATSARWASGSSASGSRRRGARRRPRWCWCRASSTTRGSRPPPT